VHLLLRCSYRVTFCNSGGQSRQCIGEGGEHAPVAATPFPNEVISFPAFTFSFLSFILPLFQHHAVTMRLLHFEVLVQLAVLVAVGSSGTVYVTDLPIYSVLGQYSCREALLSMARSMYHYYWYKFPAIHRNVELSI
jgi:hypothetical protein